MKYIDIHTHHVATDSSGIAVRNLSLSAAEAFVVAGDSGAISVGIHPWDAGHPETQWADRLMDVCRHSSTVLIGECGLDKHAHASLQTQTAIFETHIHLSETVCKPLIIHCVGCFNELIDLKKRHKPAQRWIVHGFRGKPPLAIQLLKMGIDLSFGEQFNADSVKATPVDRLFVETDESPMPIAHIYARIASVKGCNPEALNAGERLLNHLSNVN